jgi:hypothetical protein
LRARADLRDDVVARFAAERVFEAGDFAPRFAEDFVAFDPRAGEREAELFAPPRAALDFRAVEPLLERFVEELFAEDFLAPELFDEELLLVLCAADRVLFAPDLRDAADFLAPLLRDVPLLAAFLAPLEPEPPFLPPPSCLLTVAQARRSASSSDTPRLS